MLTAVITTYRHRCNKDENQDSLQNKKCVYETSIFDKNVIAGYVIPWIL